VKFIGGVEQQSTLRGVSQRGRDMTRAKPINCCFKKIIAQLTNAFSYSNNHKIYQMIITRLKSHGHYSIRSRRLVGAEKNDRSHGPHGTAIGLEDAHKRQKPGFCHPLEKSGTSLEFCVHDVLLAQQIV
jgi:hypothetical protein